MFHAHMYRQPHTRWVNSGQADVAFRAVEVAITASRLEAV